MTALSRYFVVGGAGFIGSHMVDALLADPSVERVTVYDNFSSGRSWHLVAHEGDSRLVVIRGDVKDSARLATAMAHHDCVVHLASNPDISRAMVEPSIDFDEGTLLTHRVAEAMRTTGTGRILYASGSGVYGDLGYQEVTEDHGPLLPVSTYGASKLAGEALLCSYASMFGTTAAAFRFANVVGPRQTHGVGFDFLRKLLADPTRLPILGDGQQSKSYIHVDDVVHALRTIAARAADRFEVFNVGTGDYLTVTEIAVIAMSVLGLDPQDVALQYTGGDRGWKGDVPIVRLSTERLEQIGWKCTRTSHEALEAAMRSMLTDAQAGRLW